VDLEQRRLPAPQFLEQAHLCRTRPLTAYQISSRRGWMPLRSLSCSTAQPFQSTCSSRCCSTGVTLPSVWAMISNCASTARRVSVLAKSSSSPCISRVSRPMERPVSITMS
jgi:hypothetical protein